MRTIFLFITLATSCTPVTDKEPDYSLCDSARNKFQTCLEYTPYFECDDSKANLILNKNCEEIKIFVKEGK